MRNWLYRLLHNVFINQKTERARARRQVPLESMPTVPSDPARQEDQVACQDIADVMRMLPHDQRAAIALTAVDGLSYDEAAEVLNVPIGTVRSRVARGRARMLDLYVQPRSSMRLRRVK
jgi:RNA polymerase sigma-70 factor (ECF subfamily)